MSTPAAREDRDERSARGWMLLGQILLAIAAAVSLPLGARDGGGVSSILPPLRASLPGSPTAEVSDEGSARIDQAIEAEEVVPAPALPSPPAPPPVDAGEPVGRAEVPPSPPPTPGHSRAPPSLV